jgi:predicted ATP-dependent protease
MESMEVIEIAWKAMKKEGSIHELAGKGVDAILREAMRRKGSDNLTAIMLCLSDLK